eukprot:scaffold64589_cov17-Tisochrysis_lutea.AAC.1
MVQLLLNSPEVKVDSRDADEAPALHFAIQEGHVEVRLPQQELLRAKPIQGLDCSGLTHHNSLEIKFVPKAGVVKELIRRGADINSKDWKQSTPLTSAASTGQVRISAYLLQSLHHLLFCDSSAQAQECAVDICKLLIEEGADVMHMTFGGVMAVHRAAQRGSFKA